MKVLIYGKGWLAGHFSEIMDKKNILHEFGNERVNFKNLENLRKEIDEIKPTHILSCLGRTHGDGYTSIDYLENMSKTFENLNDNIFAPIILALEASTRSIHFTYLGTGCIFEYDEKFTLKNGVKEDDEPNFTGSAYSTAKSFTDGFFRNYLKDALSLRIRMPISKKHHPRNFISKILSYPKINSIQNSVTCVEDLFPYAVEMMENKLSGTFNLTNTGTISHSQIIDYYTIHRSPKHIVQYVPANQLSIKAKRSNVFLDNSKLRELFPIRSAEEVVFEILDKFPKNL